MNLQNNSQKIDLALDQLNSGNFEESAKIVIEILSTEPDDIYLEINGPGILIDIGASLSSPDFIKRGISYIENLIPKIDSNETETISLLNYNLSNGYSAEAELLDKNNESEKYKELIQKQKKCLQAVLLKAEHTDPETLCRVMSNYGYLLYHLGRFSEASDYLYQCIEISPKHAVAICNCSTVLQRMLNLSFKHNLRIRYEFWRLTHEASELPGELTKYAGSHMFSACKSSLQAIEDYFTVISNGLKDIKENYFNFEACHSFWEPTPDLKLIRDERLFLTVNPVLSNCIDHYRDDICFENIVSALTNDGEKRFQRLANTFNHIKEDFATARYLYYRSRSASEKLSKISSITYYIESGYGSDFGLKTGFLKTSFRLAADLLDKAAGFINLYLEIGHLEDEVTLNNIWYLKRSYNKGLHPIIQECIGHNSYLFALNDLNKDLYLGIYPAPIRDLRNEATHKRLILSLYGSYDEYDKRIDFDEFVNITYLLLRMAKAATIYLVGLVSIEEGRRNLKLSDLDAKKQMASGLTYKMDFGLSDQCNLSEI